MGTAQILVLMASLIILGLLTLQFTGSSGRNAESNLYNQALLTGTGIGQSLLEEIRGKAFDEAVIPPNDTIQNPTLTPVISLGRDAGETTYDQFDDIDDYNNYSRTDSMSIFGNFFTTAKVYYIVNDIANMGTGVYSATPTFAKKIDVVVWNSFLRKDNTNILDTIRLTGIKAY